MNFNYKGQSHDVRQMRKCNICGETKLTAPVENKEICLACEQVIAECTAVCDSNDIPAREAAQERYKSIMDTENAREVLEAL